MYGYYTQFLIYHGIADHGNKDVFEKYYEIRYIRNKKDLYTQIIKEIPKCIILYGHKIEMLTYGIHRVLKQNKIKCDVLLDVQACVEEKLEYAPNFKRKLMYPAYYMAFRLAISNVDGAFVVSEELKENCERKLLLKRKLKYYKVRCGITRVLNLEEVEINREKMRKDYSINNKDVVFVYSGYRMAWQKIDEIIKDFQKYDKMIDNSYFMFFCNTDEAFEQQLDRAFPRKNYFVGLLKKDEYEKTLCGCDVGYILRDYKETNKVAFPNKFSDYLSAGLLIGMNKALPEPMRVLRDNKIPYLDTDNLIEENVQIVEQYLKHRGAYLRLVLSACEKELLYSSQIKKTKI